MSDLSDNYLVYATDQSLLKTIGTFVRHHRLKQNKSQSKVAQEAGISRSTLSLMERGEKTVVSNLLKVLRVLDKLALLEVFKVQEEISPVDYLKMRKKERQRASAKLEEPPLDELEW
jgi:transcriptional regulator with XRE-family HTH domain